MGRGEPQDRGSGYVPEARSTAHVGPASVTLARGWTRLSTWQNGTISPAKAVQTGFFSGNTLLFDGWQATLDGVAPEVTLSGLVSPAAWFATYREPGSTEEGNLPPGVLPRAALELRLGRSVDGGLREDWWLTNYDRDERALVIEVRIAAHVADELALHFADDVRTEVPIAPRYGGAHVELAWSRAYGRRKHTPPELRAEYPPGRAPADGDEIRRGCTLRVDPASEVTRVEPLADGAGLRIHVTVGARGEAHFALLYEPELDGWYFRAPEQWDPAGPPRTDGPRLTTGDRDVDATVAQAQADLDTLALPVLHCPEAPRTLAAGLPLYLGMFGRDSLTAAWQAALFSPRWMEPALGRLAALQTGRIDAFRAGEPGRMPHERRHGPRSAAGARSYELYYGDIVTPPFWLVTLLGAYSWLGDADGLLDRHFATAERCADWIERALDRGVGLVWDFPRRGDATRHHAWKDSGDAVVDGQGRIRTTPLALVEEQGYCYLGLISFATLLGLRGHVARAAHVYGLAKHLKDTFNATFWMPAQGFYAVAIDADGRQVDAITSNVGHALGCGIVPKARVAAVVARLLEPDMFSGWGIRTLSTENPAYDPFSYHRGPVWPVENATIAAAFAYHGFREEANRVIEGQFAAARVFEHHRLPEVFGGQPRDRSHPLPGLYPAANPLQAWSASAVALMMQTLLGLRAVAPLHTVLVEPALPEWLPRVSLKGLRVGRGLVDLAFWRDRDGRTRWRARTRKGRLRVRERPTLLDTTVGIATRAANAIGWLF